MRDSVKHRRWAVHLFTRPFPGNTGYRPSRVTQGHDARQPIHAVGARGWAFLSIILHPLAETLLMALMSQVTQCDEGASRRRRNRHVPTKGLYRATRPPAPPRPSSSQGARASIMPFTKSPNIVPECPRSRESSSVFAPGQADRAAMTRRSNGVAGHALNALMIRRSTASSPRGRNPVESPARRGPGKMTTLDGWAGTWA